VKQYSTMLLCILLANMLVAQDIKIKVFDLDTKEPLRGATVSFEANKITTLSDGSFVVPDRIKTVSISYAGYQTINLTITERTKEVALPKLVNDLDEVVVSANRDVVKRSQAPIAIGTISTKLINETKASTVDQLINKISGVYMVNLGNEQHSMSIRQPMGTRAVFMYLEDGIPVRTSGVFNHNAIMEMNMAAVKNIEVIKGPSSSLYGGEAIGGAVNFITQTGTALPTATVSMQTNNLGYRRADVQTGLSNGKLKVNVSGYYAERRNGFLPYSDFNKGIFTARVDYALGKRTNWENSFTHMNYTSDMNGGVDSVQYARKTFTSQHTFTWRNMQVSRFRSTLTHDWNDEAKTTVSLVNRSNVLDLNAAFRVRDDYRRVGNNWVGRKDLAHGEISVNSFKSYVLIAQHRQKFNWKEAVIVAGATLDNSPNFQRANYIRIKKDTLTNQYVSYIDRKDSLLTDYRNDILNYAGFLNAELSPFKNFRLVASLRYDGFRYNFDNYLPPSAFSGSKDTTNTFSAWAPKIGFTYNLQKNRGIYANYSRGFVPPQVGELYRGVKVPDLSPSVFNNLEVGGWAMIVPSKLSLDFSLYRLEGSNTIISVRFDDGSFGNANAGKTLSQGIEMGINGTWFKTVQVRFSGSYSKHEFVEYIERGVKFNGNEINSAPRFVGNAEIIWRPAKIKGFRLMAEWQGMSDYFMDQANLFSYQGFDVFNARTGYSFANSKQKALRGMEIWLNIVNVFDAYYAVNSTRSAAGRNYTLGEPRNINFGISYNFGTLARK